MRKEVALGSLKTVLASQGDASNDSSSVGAAIVITSRRLVLTTAPAVEGSFPPMLDEMNRVAASGRASCVIVENPADAAASRETSPI